MRCDPEVAPDPAEWLATAESERLDAVQRYHQGTKPAAGKPRLHAAVHVVVETQLTEGHPAAIDTMNRLIADGLRRHEALHAIGSAVAAEIFDVVKSRRPHDPDAYSRRLQDLTAAAWLTGGDE